MSVISKASLVQIPSGYGEDKLYSEVPNTAAGDFTFTRASTGTRVNADGYIEEVPWNLITYSEDFSNSSYIKDSGVTIASTNNVSPIGNNTATQINVTDSGRIYKNVASAEYRTSVYLKAGTFAYFKFVGQQVDLNLGTITSSYPSDIEDVGNGWYRISISYVTSIRPWQIQAYPDDTYTTHTTSGNYFVWGAMLNYGDTTKPYIKTTDRLNVPRLDYSGGASCPTLLLEPQRTNLIEYADFTNSYWTKTRSTIVQSGTMLGQTSYNFVSNVGLSGRVSRSGFPQDGQEYHKSVYVKYNGVRFVYFGNGNPSNSFEVIVFDFTTESITYEGSRIGRSSVTDMGNGIFRIVWTTPNSNSTAKNRFTIGFSSSATTFNDYVGDGVQGVLITSPQYEQGSFETSYIPTSGTSVTRVGDVCEGAGDATIFNDAEGVLFVEVAVFTSVGEKVINLSDGGNSNRIQIGYNTNNRLDVNVRSGGSYQVIFNYTGVTNPNSFNKIAFKYKENDFALWVNGVEVLTDTSGTTPNGLDRLNLSAPNAVSEFFYGKCKQLVYFNEALTDTELETLTTI